MRLSSLAISSAIILRRRSGRVRMPARAGPESTLSAPGGYTSERRLERRLRDRFLAVADELCAKLTKANYAEYVSIAEAPMRVRGFGPVRTAAAADLAARLGLAES